MESGGAELVNKIREDAETYEKLTGMKPKTLYINKVAYRKLDDYLYAMTGDLSISGKESFVLWGLEIQNVKVLQDECVFDSESKTTEKRVLAAILVSLSKRRPRR